MKNLSLKDVTLLIISATIFKLSGHMDALNYNFLSWGIVMGIGWFILNVALDGKDD